ncbi:MAG: hypothetical protein IT361_04800 [Gemmatimonadaceae bacterium]|nr:hypothetical protein [Gemmatimonadaceae bacterium]
MTIRWNATVSDTPETEPYAVIGDLVLAVRTPRSRDFVTVEVASSARATAPQKRAAGVLLSPRPTPCLADQWHGEVHLGDAVSFDVDGARYRLTLARLSETPAGMPWVTCDFLLERD